MLVRWYQTHRRYREQRLRVITLTRDPVTFYISSFIQRRVSVLPDVRAWQRARLGAAAGAELDDAQAVQDFAAELASIIATAGVDKGDAPVEIAHNRWPDHPVVAQEVKTCLRPLTWFDTELTGIFGLDVLASPELRQRGWVVLENDWVEIFALRFEQLSSSFRKSRTSQATPTEPGRKERDQPQNGRFDLQVGHPGCVRNADRAGLCPFAARIGICARLRIRPADVVGPLVPIF